MDRLIRIKEICGCSKSGMRGYLPISKSSWWAGVASGKYPSPIKLGARTTCWRESDVLALISSDNAKN
jgi:predicted DNA-binding transcriptional regulator AlpA